MEEDIKSIIESRLTQMNNHYGKGDIVNVRYDIKNNKIISGTVTRQLQYGVDMRRFTIEGDTLFYLKHQSNFKKPMVLK